MRQGYGVTSGRQGLITSKDGNIFTIFSFSVWFEISGKKTDFFFNLFSPCSTLLTPPDFILYTHALTPRSNAVVSETGDSFRDTLALTVRGDGVDIPPFFILHTYKNAARSSSRRCEADEAPVKGMNIIRMKEYVDHISQYVCEPSLLVMDRLSSHTSGETIRYIRSKTTPTGEPLLFPILLPAKTAFLISPLDMGAIGAFKSKFHQLDRSTHYLKKRAVQQAWDDVSNQTLKNICLNCGVIGEESLQSLRTRFLEEVVGMIPKELELAQDYYDAWKSGEIDVEGASRGRGVTLETPQQVRGGHLDGEYWSKYGGAR